MGIDAEVQFETSRRLHEAELADLRYRVYDAFGDMVWIRHKGGGKIGPIERHAIDEISDCRYEVNLVCRYYGVGYERGPWPELAGLIEWLWAQPLVLRVFYDGDCSEKPQEIWPDRTEIIWNHFVRYGHLPYLGTRADKPCPDCGGGTWNSAWTRGKNMYSCPGCGWSDWESEQNNEQA